MPGCNGERRMAISKNSPKVLDPHIFYTDFKSLNPQNHRVTSHPTPAVDNPPRPYSIHNCFALAIGDESKWWWPTGYGHWPNKPAEESVDELVRVLTTVFKFRVCKDGRFEKHLRKIAIFANDRGVPTHVAF